jgi:hypothetical protein
MSISCCSLPEVHLCCTSADAESMLCELFIKRENIRYILSLKAVMPIKFFHKKLF